ncbi:MAG: heavy metal translocating P-type ATPase [Chthoniobacterales bacterium]
MLEKNTILPAMAGCCQCQSKANAQNSDSDSSSTGIWMRMVFAVLIAGQSMIFGLAASMSPPVGTARLLIHGLLALSAIAVFLLVGLPIFTASWSAFRARKIVIEQLFLAGIIGAFFASLHSTLTGNGDIYYEVVAILVAIYTFGKLIGDNRRAAAVAYAKQLGEEFQICEAISCDGTWSKRKVSELAPHDRVRVTEGGGIPVDGIIREGSAFVQESALTGETFPVVKRPGDRVYAGSYVVDHPLIIEATQATDDRLLDRLLNQVREAQSAPSRLQREADKLVQWFLPIVLLVATGTFLFWTLRDSWLLGVFNALAVLVVACPCSMGLATPIGIWGALGALARRGIITKDSDLIEKLSSVDTVVFDKTGTLGEEHLSIVDFVAAEENSDARQKVLEAVAIVENASSHPIARAFRQKNITRIAKEVEVLPGCGLRGKIFSTADSDIPSENGKLWEIGNKSLVDLHQQSQQAEKLRSRLVQDPASCQEVFICKNGALVGLALLREHLRDGARATIQALQGQNYECLILTGDRAESAAVHGFDKVESNLSPEDKARRIKALEAEGRHVLFVGDGTNDAPAMSLATAAISISNGSPLAGHAASAEIPGSALAALPDALACCRRTVRAIRRNLLFAAAYNTIGITLAAIGVIHPILAATLMLVSSFTVTWSALRGVEKEISGSTPKPRPPKTTKLKNNPDQKAGHPLQAMAKKYACVVLPAGLFLQGPLIIYLTAFTTWSALGILAIFSLAAIGAAYLLRNTSPPPGVIN